MRTDHAPVYSCDRAGCETTAEARRDKHTQKYSAPNFWWEFEGCDLCPECWEEASRLLEAQKDRRQRFLSEPAGRMSAVERFVEMPKSEQDAVVAASVGEAPSQTGSCVGET